MGVAITGLNETVRAARRAGVEAQDLKDAFAPISDAAAAKARAGAPRRTGNLAGRVRASRRQNSAVITVSGTRYHRHVHFGSKHNPRPVAFMYDAVDALAASGFIERAVADGMSRALRQAGF